MQRTICDLVKTAIETSGLQWLDVVCGMVEEIKVTNQQGDGTVIKTLPAYRLAGQTQCEAHNDYIYCIPDTSKESLIYIEADNQSLVSSTSRYDEYQLPLRVICWTNLKVINQNYSDASLLTDELLSIIPDSLAAYSPYNTIRVDVTDVNRDLGVVNKYDFNEAENQMWIYPFDFFVISLRVTYRRTRACSGHSSMLPSGCKVY